MSLFSERYGHEPVRSVLQVGEMDTVLRTSLWNALEIHYWCKGNIYYPLGRSENSAVRPLVTSLWLHYFKEPLDEVIGKPWDTALRAIRQYFFSCKWNKVYDFIEFIPNGYPDSDLNDEFRSYCNFVLEREKAGYRFVGKEVTPITSQEEIVEIEQALASKGSLEPMAIHLQTALALMSDRETPDYRNSIKESISAVEAICKLITNKEKATLGQALKAMTDRNLNLHPALQEAFAKLYTYTSDDQGIRHALMDESSLDFEDAKFMLVSCSAFINYLKVKSSKAGIDLEAT